MPTKKNSAATDDAKMTTAEVKEEAVEETSPRKQEAADKQVGETKAAKADEPKAKTSGAKEKKTKTGAKKTKADEGKDATAGSGRIRRGNNQKGQDDQIGRRAESETDRRQERGGQNRKGRRPRPVKR